MENKKLYEIIETRIEAILGSKIQRQISNNVTNGLGYVPISFGNNIDHTTEEGLYDTLKLMNIKTNQFNTYDIMIELGFKKCLENDLQRFKDYYNPNEVKLRDKRENAYKGDKGYKGDKKDKFLSDSLSQNLQRFKDHYNSN